MSSEKQSMMPAEKLPKSEQRELSDGAAAFAHTATAAVATLIHVLERSVPDLDTSANVFKQPYNEALTHDIAPEYTAVRYDGPVTSEIDPDFAADFSRSQLWDGSRAQGADDGTEPAYRPIEPTEAYVEYRTEPAPAYNPYAEATSAPEIGIDGPQIDPHLRYVEAVQPGGVFDQDEATQRQAGISDAQARLDNVYAQQGGQR